MLSVLYIILLLSSAFTKFLLAFWSILTSNYVVDIHEIPFVLYLRTYGLFHVLTLYSIRLKMSMLAKQAELSTSQLINRINFLSNGLTFKLILKIR